MKILKHIKILEEICACSEAIEWAKGFETAQEAWDNCERGDWMLWFIGNTDTSEPYSEERKPLVKVSFRCARLAWKRLSKEAKTCVELHERWVNGENISIEELSKAKTAAAYAAANSAADAAYFAANANSVASAAANSAAYAAAYTSAAFKTARKAALKKCAEIIREAYPKVDSIFKGK